MTVLEKVAEAIISALEKQGHTIEGRDYTTLHLHQSPYATDMLAVAEAAVKATTNPFSEQDVS